MTRSKTQTLKTLLQIILFMMKLSHRPTIYIWKACGENADDFKGYMELQGRRKVSILIDNMHEVDVELKIRYIYRYYIIYYEFWIIL